jgi:hypothetical protein
LVIGWAGVWAFSLSRSLLDPFAHDHGLYQFLTERIIAGQRMYTDVWDQNAPGILLIHWLSTKLIGSEQLDFRIFDACWQAATMIVVALLATRTAQKWSVGILAAILYSLSYYSLGYVQTAQREGFAALPVLVTLWATWRASEDTSSRKRLALSLLAGVSGCFVFAIKPPLGLCYGICWLWTLGNTIRSRWRHLPTWTPMLGLTIGFTAAALMSVGWLIHLGWWSGYWPVLTRTSVPGYIKGPTMIRQILPSGLLMIGSLTAVLIGLYMVRSDLTQTRAGRQRRQWLRLWTIGCCVIVFWLTVQHWPSWQDKVFLLWPILLPLGVAAFSMPWSERSAIWQLTIMVAAACLAAIVFQGWFYRYHFPPLLALGSIIMAHETAASIARFHTTTQARRIWSVSCVAAIVYLVWGIWWPTMTRYGSEVNLLAHQSLAAHYDHVTRGKPTFPPYAATAVAAARARELTAPDEPIACLLDDPRLYLQAKRPPVCPLIRTQPCYQYWFDDLIEAIRNRRPKAVFARMPANASSCEDVTCVNANVFADIEQLFGNRASILAEDYVVTEVIDDEICLLEPR